MKKTATLLLTLCLLLMAFASTKAQTIVYNSTSSQYYRIPAMATAYDGTLLLFGDNRYSHNADVGSSGNARIDVMLTRVSYNTSSATYSSPSTSTATNITSGYSSISQCYGDAAVVADRESNNVRLICVGGSNGWTSNKEHYTMLSTNNGQTWSTPTLLSVPNTSDINGFFFASGRIFQSRVIKNGSYYRIYTALLTPAYENRVYYSDDFGGSWTQLGGTAVTSGDEAKLEELPNGDVIISSRYAGGRRFNKYHYTNTATAAGSWGTQGSCAFTAGCAVNGEMLTFEAYRTSDNTQVTLMLLSTATGYSRISVKVFYREIDNNTTVSDLSNINNWSSYGPLPNTSSSGAYSTMTLLKNNNIGLFYEGQSEAGYDLYYIAYTLEELTNQAYTFDEPVVV
ncbi:MAG: sialidase family protein, partial [Bacteroidales bacterium]|nr:sialidase family protein [Bacteroidales bacterium]